MKSLNAVLVALFLGLASNASGQVLGAGGLKDMTAAEKIDMLKKQVRRVRPNALGVERINQHRREKGLPDLGAPKGEEIEFGAGEETLGSVTDDLGSTPAQVDNSALKAFPAIGDQKRLGSCVAWSTTYYLMSHEVCLTLGCDNKNKAERVFSPMFTYNLINGGKDGGSSFASAYAVLNQLGAVSNTEFPYGTDYTKWDTETEHWRTAINYRMVKYSALDISTDSGLASLKQVLTNGHVVNFGTYAHSWIKAKVANDPAAASNPFAGQEAVTGVNGKEGPHAITMVGYDDSVFVDLNGDGKVQSNEKGAFKIANSWGPSHHNAGFFWATYESVKNGGFINDKRVYMMTYTAYSPKLLAKVKLSTARRDQITLALGISDKSASSAASSLTITALDKKGGAFAFNGTTTEAAASIYLDVSDLIGNNVDANAYYLTASDSASGSALTTYEFSLYYPSGGVFGAAAGVPVSSDKSSQTLRTAQVVVDSMAPSVPRLVNATLYVTPTNSRKVAPSYVYLTWKASTDNVGIYCYAIYRNGVYIGYSWTPSFADTTVENHRLYQYLVFAIDAAGNWSNRSNGEQILVRY